MRITELCVGPMSKNAIDAVIYLNNFNKINLPLISSRRQIESKKIGKGYVNNFTTEDYSNYIKSADTKKDIRLCRDHGGPWQSSEIYESQDFIKSNDMSKLSFEQDIISGFKFISSITFDITLTSFFPLLEIGLSKSVRLLFQSDFACLITIRFFMD